MHTFALALGWVVACAPPRLPDPVVTAVEPSFAYNAEDEPVTIVGDHFWPRVTLDAGNGPADVERGYRAWLVGPDGGQARHELVGVAILDREHLSALVETGLQPGSYGLEVQGPTGGLGKLDGTFVVTDEQAAQLALHSDVPFPSVTEDAPITVELLDLDQERVTEPFEVEFTAVAEGGGAVELRSETLAEPIANGSLRGVMRGGSATVLVRSQAPGSVTVTAQPVEPESKVARGTFVLQFRPGEEWQIQFELPPADGLPEAVAGEPFEVVAEVVDQYGNLVEERTEVALGTRCSGLLAAGVVLEGRRTVQLVPEIATSDDGCHEDRVVVELGPFGESAPFTVVAGPTHHFLVGLVGLVPAVRAGTEVGVIAEAKDAYDNPAVWTAPLTFENLAGGLLETECVPGGPFNFCNTTPTIAHPADVITVTGAPGVMGTSPPLLVRPDDVAAAATVTGTGPVAAGVPFPVEVRGLDGWGNVMEAADLGDVVLTDELGEISCVPAAALPDAATFECTLYTARSEAFLNVELADFGVLAASSPFTVTNGALAVVRFSGEAPVQAGQPLALSIVAEDAYGNRYRTQVNPVIDLADDTGTFSLASTTLGPDGSAPALGSFTVAGATTVHASQGGVALGSSGPIVVGPGPATGLAVDLLPPWAWEDQPADVQVQAVDAWGNRADETGPATLTSVMTASPVVPITLVNGVGTAPFTWTEAVFSDELRGDRGALTGSTDVVVARDCDVDGPVPALSFGGYPEAIACVDAATGIAPIVADLSASTPGLQPITGYAAARNGGPTVANVQPVLNLELPGTGAWTIHGLAYAADGCGAELEATGWAGPDDNTPVGPIPLVTTASDVPVSTVVAPVGIDLTGIVDCSRDPAAFQQIFLRTTAGTLTGPTPTGQGPALVLDAAGEGTIDLDTDGGLSNGLVTVHAWVASGAAGGRLELPLVGDAIRPIVIGQDPSGVEVDLVDELVVSFSEPMLSSLLTDPVNWAVAGPTPVTLLSIASSGDSAVLTIDPPADPAAGLWTVTASALRDAAGNRLAGEWNDVATPYVGVFGGAGGPPAQVACTAFAPAGLTLRPDGDDGADAEADQLVVSVSSAAAPAWWVIEVTDEAGGLVHLDWEVPLGPADTVEWDGRGLDGTVVANGRYRLEVEPDDGVGNRGDGCAVTVTVDNRLGAAP